MIWRLALLICLCAPCVNWAAEVSEWSKRLATVPVPSTYFGMHLHRALPNRLWEIYPIGAVRLHDANVAWRDLQAGRGVWNFERLDSLVRRFREHRADILLPLSTTPQWASSEPSAAAAYGPGAASMPSDLADWVTYVEMVASRYRGLITHYEIWNEPNLKEFFRGTPAEMAALTNAACKAIRRVDPSAKIVSASGTGDYGIAWWKNYLRLVSPSCIDVLGYHFYTKHKPPEVLVSLAETVWEAVIEVGLESRPIWNTESGWLIAGESPTDPSAAGFGKDAKILSAGEASDYVVRALLLGRWAGLGRFYWYAWDNASMGMTEGRGVSARPAALAFSAAARLLTGVVVKGCGQIDEIWSCRLERQDGARQTVVWTTAVTKKNWTPSRTQSFRFGPWNTGCQTAATAGGEVVLSSTPMIVCVAAEVP